jgi:phenylalanyl-tRNA synthetase beta chain
VIISWNWLKELVAIDATPDEVAHRLAMSGLNHEATVPVGDDLAIELEVTSNRPDCLAHIGVGREVAVLWNERLVLPDPRPAPSQVAVEGLIRVRIDCPHLCRRYTARVVQGVRVAPSPAWLQQRLQTLGISPVNNVVDITNYVMMECGQPLHAFDFAKLAGREIIVRDAFPGERFVAIDHRTYDLAAGMCVIGDPRRAVALGGVMGGADTEISNSTTDLLIEAADFNPLSIRTTARNLNLHSDSSYRFERGIDWEQIDWASRRCCQLILELAGGKLAAGVVDVVARPCAERQPLVLRLRQLPRILGIAIDWQEVRRILAALGNCELSASPERIEVLPPSWRRDLTREADLIEEVARIHGYDAIPEDTQVSVVPSHRSDQDRVVARIRGALTASGFDEAITASFVETDLSEAFSPWTQTSPLSSQTPMLRNAHFLRRSLVPSLLDSLRLNQSLSNEDCDLFEIARVYLPKAGQLPDEPLLVALASRRDFRFVKGVIETLLQHLNSRWSLRVTDVELPLCATGYACRLTVDGKVVGFLGSLSEAARKQFDLRRPATIAELSMELLAEVAQLVPQYHPPSVYPPISRDLNLVFDQRVRWADVAQAVRAVCGELLESLDYRETYYDPDKDGAHTKRLLFSFRLRAMDRTLTGDAADEIRDRVVTACEREFGARMLG